MDVLSGCTTAMMVPTLVLTVLNLAGAATQVHVMLFCYGNLFVLMLCMAKVRDHLNAAISSAMHAAAPPELPRHRAMIAACERSAPASEDAICPVCLEVAGATGSPWWHCTRCTAEAHLSCVVASVMSNITFCPVCKLSVVGDALV